MTVGVGVRQPWYNPQTDPSTIEFNEERVKDWLSKGAQPSETVQRLLKAKGL